MKQCLIIAVQLLCFFIASTAQQKIETTKTGHHINVPGTQVWIHVPEGFENASTFTGLQHAASGTSLMVLQIPATSESIAAGFNAQALATKGIKYIATETYEINSREAILILSEQFSAAHGYTFLKYSFIISTGKDASLLINVNVPEKENSQLYKKLKASLLSVYMDKNIVLNEFSSLDFTIEYASTKFKLQKSMTGTLMFKGPDESSLIIAKSVRALDNSDKKGASIIALKVVKQIKFENIISSKEIKADDADAYQILANIKINDTPAKALQTIIFCNNYYYDFLLVMNTENADLIKDYDAILKSFKRK